MKAILKIGLFFLLAFPLSSCASYEGVAQPAPVEAVSYQTFYDALSPYGQWINYPGYGYVWAPNAGAGFVPYQTGGYWVYTSYGWTWASNFAWGWAPFHYGRWFYDNFYGWVWVPGTVWGPAWVAWRQTSDYYGWAPLLPGINISINIGNRIPSNYWVFVPQRYITSRSVGHYYVSPRRNVTIINNSTIINNVYNGRGGAGVRYFGGPPHREVEQVTRTNIRPVRVVNTSTPTTRVSNNSLEIYRPRVVSSATGNNGSSAPAPARVIQARPANNGVAQPQRPVENNNAGENRAPTRTTAPRQNNVPAPSQQARPAAPQRTITPPTRSNVPQVQQRAPEPTRRVTRPAPQRTERARESSNPAPVRRVERR